MGQLTITLSDDLEAKVRKHVREKGYDSVSDFVRELVSRATSGRPTYWERAHLVQLMEIKKLLGEEVNEELLDAIRDGYPLHYLSGYYVEKEEMSDEDMEFVHSVLRMYGDLQHSYKRSENKDPEIEKALLFPGFDGNAGDGHLGYLHFLVKHKRYTFVEPLNEGRDSNSHFPVTSMYERMLSKYKSIKFEKIDSPPLTLNEIRDIIKEQIHPEHSA